MPVKNDIQFDFSFSGGRSNHQISLINNTGTLVNLTQIRITVNTSIKNPWGNLAQQWKNVKQEQKGNTYIYTLPLEKGIDIKDKTFNLLKYSASSALGPITNVAMPPQNIEIQLADKSDWIEISLEGQGKNISNPHPGSTLEMYHANWGQYAYKRNMKNEAWDSINELNFSFIGFDESGKVFSLDSWADNLGLPQLYLQQKRNPYLRTTIAFGGWTNSGKRMDTVFSKMASSKTSRQNFIKNAVAAVKQAGVNGVVLDWEYVKQADALNFIALLSELRTALEDANIDNPYLKIAAPAASNNINVFSRDQWSVISGLVDHISVMSYDYFGGFSDVSDFHSPWQLASASPHEKTTPQFCVEGTLKIYADLGLPKEKITLGIPNYTRGEIVTKPGDYAGLYQSVVGSPKGDFGAPGGIFSWDSVLKLLNKQPSQIDKLGVKQWYHYDSSHELCKDANMALLSGQLPDGRWVVINFLDQAAAQWRGQQAQEQGLGGTMIWANYEETVNQKDMIATAVSKGMSAPAVQEKDSLSFTIETSVAEEKFYYKTQVERYSDKLQRSFLGKKKSEALTEISNCKTLQLMEASLTKHKATLGTQRNIFKKIITFLLPHFITKRLFKKPTSLVLAGKMLAERKMLKTRPSSVISSNKSRPVIHLKRNSQNNHK